MVNYSEASVNTLSLVILRWLHIPFCYTVWISRNSYFCSSKLSNTNQLKVLLVTVIRI